jgi:hypothetical protein
MKNFRPSIGEFVDLLVKYGKDNRVNSITASQNLPRKSTLFKLIKTDIPLDRSMIDGINLNKLLKNLIVLTSDHSCPIGDHNEYTRYKEIHDKILSEPGEKQIRDKMLKQIEDKMREYTIENEFKNNKSIHNFTKKMLMFLATNSIESNEFVKDVSTRIKGQNNGIYVAPTNTVYNPTYNRNKYFENAGKYHPPNIYTNMHAHTDTSGNENFIDIKNIERCPLITDKNLFPDLVAIKPELVPVPVWGPVLKQ